jgi:prepilin-type N-terminal cleavage/methylation domain-containing protein
MFRRFPSGAGHDDGFTMLEILAVIVVAVSLLSIGLGGFSLALDTVRGDASMNKVLWQLKLAREAAINQRRSVEVRFTPPNFVAVVRRDIPNGETVLSTTVLEHQTTFVLFPTHRTGSGRLQPSTSAAPTPSCSTPKASSSTRRATSSTAASSSGGSARP